MNNITWSAALVDFDMDGDSDLFFFDDEGVARAENLDRGAIHIWKNDGTGHFEFVPSTQTGITLGSNMGHAFGDFNCDGNLDIFVTRFGSFMQAYLVPSGTPLKSLIEASEGESSTWMFGNDDGSFRPAKAMRGFDGKRLFLPFGWGASAIDFEADGDLDIVYVGGLIERKFQVGSPGVALENLGCTGVFARSDAFPSGNYNNLVTSGISTGDLNNDGFPDLVVVAGRYPWIYSTKKYTEVVECIPCMVR